MSQPEDLIKNKLEIESNNRERPHRIGWKIYFFTFILLNLISLIMENSAIYIIARIIRLALAAPVLYSWIWAHRIGWLVYIRWLVKLWSIGFFIAPIGLLVYGYFIITKGDPEAFGWFIDIVIQYPALYIIYKIAWKSRLLYRTE